jgi:hypothetical protein
LRSLSLRDDERDDERDNADNSMSGGVSSDLYTLSTNALRPNPKKNKLGVLAAAASKLQAKKAREQARLARYLEKRK